MSVARYRTSLFPGIALSVAIAALALGLERLEIRIAGLPWVDGLVFAILIGTGLHTAIGLHPRLVPGVHFASKILLEVAIVLLGASISFAAISDAGLWLIGVVAAVVVTALTVSYGIGRMLGLSDRLATLVACGNSICGNSAIVAAAPVIEADPQEIAASIAFTAALGIIVVLLLPLAPALFGLSERQYGILAGMTVYAVPQVLAATVPVGVLSTQVGALVKLMRVLMLGPVILLLGLKAGRSGAAKIPLTRMIPWFIVGFLLMMTARSLGALPDASLPILKETSTALTIVSMAALGLSVNIRMALASGGRVLAAGTLSLLALATISAAMLVFLPLN